MANVLSPWRALRPLLLAGAVTAAWLTLSVSAATADSSEDSGSVLGGLNSAVSTLTAPLTGAVSPILEAPSPSPSPTGLLQPVAGTADQLIAAVPVVNGVVPAGTATAVAVPIAALVDAAADDLVETVAPPHTDAATVLEPVLKPVVDLVDATVPSTPVALPGVLPLEEIAVAGEISAVTDAAAAAAGHVTPDATNSPGSAANLLAVTGTSSLPVPASADMHSVPAESPWTTDPSTPAAPAPAGPVSGAGSGASPSGASGSAASLDEASFNVPLLGVFPISGSPDHAPSPVSFDPGSSPD
ncbi:hypothetical protein QK290_03520 [Pseudarthrobacter sp. AL07]|uniref:hypothetical protein n=1 Tax=unclassified Pseudarthrobacter TaxID=2647000 RepID=UPI00249BD0B4|nr:MULTISPECIES: hypothetical protein [unclassified Pseudarthrobacter]MDI3193539.1 hypothetical protein [Pseudarthrobacter sp. AL20]MDI3207607.1 hypothetical protein [Pseudarthrobacter sp. AL07]